MAAPKLSPDTALTRKVSIVLNQREDEQLEAIAKSDKRSKSFIVRAALQAYLLREKQAQI